MNHRTPKYSKVACCSLTAKHTEWIGERGQQGVRTNGTAEKERKERRPLRRLSRPHADKHAHRLHSQTAASTKRRRDSAKENNSAVFPQVPPSNILTDARL